jgi:hypothetical protein
MRRNSPFGDVLVLSLASCGVNIVRRHALEPCRSKIA